MDVQNSNVKRLKIRSERLGVHPVKLRLFPPGSSGPKSKQPNTAVCLRIGSDCVPEISGKFYILNVTVISSIIE